MNIIQQLEAEQTGKLAAERPVPEFNPGDTVRVNVKVVEGSRERIQAFEGVCIARRNAGAGSAFTVRKISYGEGVERVFPLYSPRIESIEVVRRGAVRRAKLYYLRDRRGKRARIAEAQTFRPATSGTPTVSEAADLVLEPEGEAPPLAADGDAVVSDAAPAQAKAASSETSSEAPKVEAETPALRRKWRLRDFLKRGKKSDADSSAN